MKSNILLFTFLLTSLYSVIAQENIKFTVFKSEPINFNGTPGNDTEVKRYQSGRIIYKKKLPFQIIEKGLM